MTTWEESPMYSDAGQARSPSLLQSVDTARDLQRLREQAAAAVAEADRLERHTVAYGLEPASNAWLHRRFEAFLQELRDASDVLAVETYTAAAGRASANPGHQRYTDAPAATLAAPAAPAAATSLEEVAAPPVSPCSAPDAPLEQNGDLPTVSAPTLAVEADEAPAFGGDDHSFEHDFWHDDEPPPWPIRLRSRLRLSKAAALQIGALIAAALAALTYLS